MNMAMVQYGDFEKVTPSEAKRLASLTVPEIRKIIEGSRNSADDAITLRKYAQLPEVAKHITIFKDLFKLNDIDLRSNLLKNPAVKELQARLRLTQRKHD